MFRVRTFSIGLILSLTAVLLLSITAASAQEETTKLTGTATFRDDGDNLNAKVVISLGGLPVPEAGTAYEGWLLGSNGSKVSTGVFFRAIDGSVDQEYVDPDGASLLATYGAFVVTSELVPDPDPATSGAVLYADSISAGAAPHIGHLLVAFDANPESKGIAVGLREQMALALAHAKLADASTALADKQSHAQHVVNIIEGSGGPGDGNGVLSYAADALAHVTEAKAGTTGLARIASANTAIAAAQDAKVRAEQSRNNALSVIAATELGFLVNIQLQNASVGLSAGVTFAETVYTSSQDIAAFVPVLGASPAPPSVGDGLVPTAALTILIAGLMATAAGALLLFRRRATATATA